MAFWTRKHDSQPEPVETVPQHFLLAGGQVRSLAEPENWLRELFNIASVNGMPVGRHAAMNYSASAICIRLISTVIAECPLHVYQIGQDGSRLRLRDHAGEKLLNGFVAPWIDGPSFIRDMTRQALFEGDAYARVVRVRGQARELHPLLCRVSVEYDEMTGEPSYVLTKSGGGQERLSYKDVIHLRSPTGGAPVKQAARAIELGLLIEKATAELFRNNAQPPGILKLKKPMNVKESAEVADSYAKQRKDHPGRAPVLGSDIEWIPLSFSAVDAQTLELRRNQVIDTIRFFINSPTLAGELADASLNNSEALSKQFLTYVISPWLSSWVGAITRCLIDPTERVKTYAEFETAGISSADFKATAEGLKNLVGGPIMTANDGRARLNLPRLSDGDKLYPVQGASPKAGNNPDGDKDNA